MVALAQVCIFDNRGVGRSSPIPSLLTWQVEDMASDAVSLLDCLAWSRVHVGKVVVQAEDWRHAHKMRGSLITSPHHWLCAVGVSMGGMIAQRLALKLQGRLASLMYVVPTNSIAPLLLFTLVLCALFAWQAMCHTRWWQACQANTGRAHVLVQV